MKKPLVSIIIPNYNNLYYIGDCLNSVLNQTYKNIEIIIVDDCSTDGSVVFLKEFQKKYQNVQVFFNSVNRGVSFSRNFGIAKSKGDYITTVDSDDLLLENKIEKEIHKCLSFLPKHIVCFSSYHLCDINLKKIRSVPNSNFIYGGNVYKSLLFRSIPIGRDLLYHRSLYMKTLGYDNNSCLYEDWDMMIQLSLHAEFHHSGNVGVMYRRSVDGLSRKNYQEHIKALHYHFKKYASARSLKIFDLINGPRLHNKIIRFLLYFKIFNYFLGMFFSLFLDKK